jgi:hypothetical protein
MKVSKEESILCERIFMVEMSIRFLKQGRRPFHDEAIRTLQHHKKNLNRLRLPDKNKTPKISPQGSVAIQA